VGVAPRARRRGRNTRWPTPDSCGWTWISRASGLRSGVFWPSGPATCWWNRRARAACTPTGSCAEPLAAVTVDPDRRERVEWIKRANLRLIHRIGTGPDGRPSVADEMCAEQARVMRLAGTVNYKTGRYARLVQVDLSLAPYLVSELVGDFPDPPSATGSFGSPGSRPQTRS
jgi:hypothetical protein